MEDKATLRKRILKIRDLQDPEEKKNKDRCIRKNLLSLIKERDVKCVLLFVSFRSEPDTYAIIEECLADNINVVVPKVEGNDMRFYYISGSDDLEAGYKGIMEPADGCIPWEVDPETDLTGTGDRSNDTKERSNSIADPLHTMIVVPGAVFDKEGYRIGYGGGYYDRFLKVHPGLFKAGICYDFQVTDRIPGDTWDEMIDCIVYDEGIIYIADNQPVYFR